MKQVHSYALLIVIDGLLLAFYAALQWGFGLAVHAIQLSGPELADWMVPVIRITFAASTLVPVVYFTYVDFAFIRNRLLVNRGVAAFRRDQPELVSALGQEVARRISC